ncbi:TRAP transporter small permease subunit [Cocleimonas sp. KMM 6892]|jgi:TRAP-type mannitol/chloroaromatic compound transport system permease small subunit|uniref:TRAP transporter small permease subunit n=1 Tax=unclassified Cocleimonas TaxID=2639732 RepID=UPI002DBF6BC6|nr:MULTISPECIES: TRAP transporter small permease subunit [unclassified Cocleimonas]MEB8431456.1 TRAP transporter small permease subunit [Cocleimonas sp. KMM 6892]MEC4713772.1 TRAP transporter small permease subunit [Cocleimonas sp. KMM 6895]MEC4743103.1 TRAP transporter small permease subunit [Cocleimonas sp. KMM 6896]
MKLWNTIEKAIDFIAEMMGRIGWLLIIYLMVLGVTDVFLRYVLNAPSLWISTSLQIAMVLLACVGGIYALNDNAFVKLDLFYANFSPKKKAVCDIITVVFTILFLGVLIWKGYQAAKMSVMLNQHTPTSIPLPIYPLKIFFPITGIIMLLVVIKKLVNDIRTLRS